MNPIAAGVATIGLTSSRAFIPAFVAALFLRFGTSHPWFADAAHQMLGTAQVVTWFTSDVSLVILGLLAVLEFAAQRNHDARAILSQIDQFAKPAMAAITTLGLMSPADASFIQQVAPPTTQHASVLGSLVAMSAAAGTYIVSAARNSAYQLLHDADTDDATGAHGLLAWAEDIYAALGMFLFLLFPLLMLVLIGGATGLVLLLQRRARAREEAGKIACASCTLPVYRTALTCPNCHAAIDTPRALSWLGGPTDRPADLSVHAYDLAAKRRCPDCAARLGSADPDHACPACARVPFADPAFTAAYDRRYVTRLLPTLAISAALGAIPVVGLVAGVLFYRLYLISAYRAYVGLVPNLLTRWLLRLAIFVLIALHLIPLVGVVTLPAMALLNFLAYRGIFLARARSAARTVTTANTTYADHDAPQPGTIGAVPGAF